MSDETVRPALTPEEWESPRITWTANGRHCFAECYTDIQTGMLNVLLVDAGSSAIEGRRRHALAALALHDQPFGPKSHWVEWLDREIEINARHPDGPNAGGFVLREIRDFIAALLPPEEPNG